MERSRGRGISNGTIHTEVLNLRGYSVSVYYTNDWWIKTNISRKLIGVWFSLILYTFIYLFVYGVIQNNNKNLASSSSIYFPWQSITVHDTFLMSRHSLSLIPPSFTHGLITPSLQFIISVLSRRDSVMHSTLDLMFFLSL